MLFRSVSGSHFKNDNKHRFSRTPRENFDTKVLVYEKYLGEPNKSDYYFINKSDIYWGIKNKADIETKAKKAITDKLNTSLDEIPKDLLPIQSLYYYYKGKQRHLFPGPNKAATRTIVAKR